MHTRLINWFVSNSVSKKFSKYWLIDSSVYKCTCKKITKIKQRTTYINEMIKMICTNNKLSKNK